MDPGDHYLRTKLHSLWLSLPGIILLTWPPLLLQLVNPCFWYTEQAGVASESLLRIKVVVSSCKNVFHLYSDQCWNNLTFALPFSCLALVWLALTNVLLGFSPMTLFSSLCYWHMPDKLLVCKSSPMDTRYEGEKNQKKNEIKYMKVLSLIHKMTQVVSRSLFASPLRRRQKIPWSMTTL